MIVRILLLFIALFTFGVQAQAIKESYAFAVLGEPRYAFNFNHFDYVNPAAPKGGQITLSALGTFDNFNRYALRGNPGARTEQLYDTLFTTSDDEPGSYYPLIAESARYADDYSWVEVAINPRARFHDGSPITARDVEFTFQKFMTEGVPQFRLVYKGTTVKAIAPLTVRIELAKPGKEDMLSLFSLPVFPEKYWKDHKLSDPLATPPLASGPYRVTSWKMGQNIVYSRVKDYWAANLPVNRGRWNFDTIRYDYYLDDNVAFEAFKAGAFDLRMENDAKNWATRYTGKNFDKKYIIKDEQKNESAQDTRWLAFNIQRPVFSDRRVREAITLAFDFEWMNKALFYNAWSRTNSYFQNTEYAARNYPDAAELVLLAPMKKDLPSEVFTQIYQPPVSKGDGYDRDNLLKADKLLNEAGWVLKGQQRVNATTGQPLSFELLLPASSNSQWVLPFQHSLQRLGINMDIRKVDNSQITNRMRSRDYDMMPRVWRAMPWPSSDLQISWSSEYINSTYNAPGVQSPVIDSLINQIIAAQGNKEKLLPLGRALDRVLTWNYYMLPMWYMAEDRLAWWDKFSQPAVRPIYSLGIDTWWYDVNKAAKLPSASKQGEWMGAYLIRRLLLVIPTLWAIITINFFIVQIAPGGPVDQAIAAIEFGNAGVLPGAGGEGVRASHAQTGVGNISDSNYRGGRGLDPEVIAEITHRYGFDKPIHERYFKMLWDYIRFDFGDSLFRSASVLTLIKDSLPVSITLGLWSTLIIYLVSIPLGIRKAVYNGSRFDVWSSAFIIIGYAIPAFLFAILLIVFFAGGSYFDLFPLRGLVSANFDSLPWYQKITDYLWHITLPVLATVIGGFAALTMLTKNSFLDEVRKQYVVTARAKGVSEKNILWKHVFRNAMLLVIAGFPATFISMFFTGSLLIEVMFSLNGLGLLGYEATVSRDYPVMFGTLYIFTLIGLLLNIVSDISYTLVDPRIDFEGR